MTPHVLANHDALSRSAADWLVARLRQWPEALVCLAAGATPLETYALLAQHHEIEPALFQRIRTIKLDEWGGMGAGDRASCEHSLRQTIIEPLQLTDRYVAFDGQAADPAAECARIAGWLRDNGPIDLCVLGLGVNGHLGFNEPAPHLQPRAHVAELADQSRQHAMLEAASVRPTYGLTLGMADLLQAREILLLVSGLAKAAPLRQLLGGQISTGFPASFLWLHANVTLLCDAAAHG